MAGRKRFVATKKKTTRKAANPGVQALRMVKTLRNQVKPEVKSQFFEFDNIVPSTGGITNFHSTIPIGPQDHQHIGDFIKPFRLVGRIALSQSVLDEAAYSQSIRLIFFRFKQDNGVLPSVGDYLKDTVEPEQRYLALKNPENAHHWNTIYDKTFTLSKGNNATRNIIVNLPLHGLLQYQHNSDEIVEQNGIFLLMISDINGAALPPRIRANFTMFYTDC